MRFLSRKFLLAAVTLVAFLLKHFLGIELTDSQIEQVVDAIVILGTVVGYIIGEAMVDKARAQGPVYLPFPVVEEATESEGEQ